MVMSCQQQQGGRYTAETRRCSGEAKFASGKVWHAVINPPLLSYQTKGTTFVSYREYISIQYVNYDSIALREFIRYSETTTTSTGSD